MISKKSHRFGGRREFILGGHQIKSIVHMVCHPTENIVTDRQTATLATRDSKKFALTGPKRRGPYHERILVVRPCIFVLKLLLAGSAKVEIQRGFTR